jgi:hypothetical protein
MFLTETLKDGVQVILKKSQYTSLSDLRGKIPASLLPYRYLQKLSEHVKSSQTARHVGY